ncbi:MAG: ABC transporter permease [Oscillospiraceae bacterium]|jgi:peptide/nickel transport system permease protein|nr:ABC transporter permease [Oscillospiraceae bacterium]
MGAVIIKTIAVYVARGITLLLAVSVLSFALASASPIDPETRYRLSHPGVSDENVERMREYWGIDEPPVKRYFAWLGGVLRGEWGTSTAYRQPVLDVVGVRFKTSLALMMTAWTFSGLLGFSVGCVMGVFRGRWQDRVIKRVCLIMCSIPTFWIGLVFLAVFAAALGWFPFGLAVPPGVPPEAVTLGQRIHHIILPAMTLGFLSFANLALHTREKLIDAYGSDWAIFARARGESDVAILFQHGIRNALIPAVTMQLGSFAELFGGSVFAESIFSYPGLGAAVSAAGTGATDIPLFLGIVIFTACFIFAGNLIANVLTLIIDPRTRRSTGI